MLLQLSVLKLLSKINLMFDNTGLENMGGRVPLMIGQFQHDR